MFNLIFAILLGLACPSNSNTNTGNNNGGTVRPYDGGTGGDGGHIIPPPRP
ncbi:MAG: hypothetical protein QHC79_15315 [Pseudosphingobacterium sp.]|jgi:hypothetical protein|nr:hypothetical protein [Pseudosphingobacterium sp.]